MATPVSSAITALDEVKSAEKAGLRYLIPAGTGIRRRRAGAGFVYLDPDNRPIRSPAALKRIRSLAIPPAWTSVWISPDANGHIQAVGRDARGRKQYRYHSLYRHIRDLAKFDRMRAFGKVLPRIRRLAGRDLARKGMGKRKVLAAIVKLLETTYIRIGNEEYVEENGSFGLTTLRNQHVQVLGQTLKFHFKGKSHQHQEITIQDSRLARIVRRCKDIPGSQLFEYLDDAGTVQTVESGDVNEYLREIAGGDFTAKDFRTWGGTCLAAAFLLERCANAEPTKTALVEVVKEVSSKLGNKPPACRKYYIHPAVLDCYTEGRLAEIAQRFRGTEQIVFALIGPPRGAH
ncbi:MAG: DNA topoisomerase IB, partial [Bryobacteraceae bacterium]